MQRLPFSSITTPPLSKSLEKLFWCFLSKMSLMIFMAKHKSLVQKKTEITQGKGKALPRVKILNFRVKVCFSLYSKICQKILSKCLFWLVLKFRIWNRNFKENFLHEYDIKNGWNIKFFQLYLSDLWRFHLQVILCDCFYKIYLINIIILF